MAILYFFKAETNNDVDPFPPSVIEDESFIKLSDYLAKNSTTISGGFLLMFDTESELDVFLEQYTITDSKLLADISTWKKAHNIIYTSKYYTLPDLDSNKTGLFS